MAKFCFTTYVYGWYQDYIPIYIYSILLEFPQHFVKIFLKESLSDTNKEVLALLRDQISDSFEVIENFKDLDWCDLPHLPANRFLLTRDYFSDFDYIYFGDIDFLIYNENDDEFFDSYVAHCQKTGLPFSNEWNYDWGRYRMTGLHFVIKDRYFDQIDQEIELMKIPNGNHFRRECLHRPRWPSYDEEMLYYMASRVFDLSSLRDYRRPFHGLHFGTFREIALWNSYSKNHERITDGRNYLPQWMNNKKINKIFESSFYKDYISPAVNDEVKNVIQKVEFALYQKMFL